jgi:hypothetical protein
LEGLVAIGCSLEGLLMAIGCLAIGCCSCFKMGGSGTVEASGRVARCCLEGLLMTIGCLAMGCCLDGLVAIGC